MKKAFTISSLLILSVLLFAGCYKRDVIVSEDYWLSKERGEVVYSDSYCDYFVVETASGYTVIRSYSGYKPYEGSIVYGDLSFRGTADFYNRSSGVVFTGAVTDYWLSYFEAQDAVDFYCPFGIYSKTSSQSGFRKKTGEIKK
ncbi:MAG: hypothetical protein ACHQFX_01570 [Chitinophagales bacterium]